VARCSGHCGSSSSGGSGATGVVDIVRVGPGRRSIWIDRERFLNTLADPSLYVSRAGGQVRCEELSLSSGRTRSRSERVLISPAARRFYRDLRAGLPVPGERLWWIWADGRATEWWRRIRSVRFLEPNGNWVSGVGRGAELLALALFALAFVLFFAGADLGDGVGLGLVWTATALIPVLVIDLVRVWMSDRKGSGNQGTFDVYH